MLATKISMRNGEVHCAVSGEALHRHHLAEYGVHPTLAHNLLHKAKILQTATCDIGSEHHTVQPVLERRLTAGPQNAAAKCSAQLAAYAVQQQARVVQ